MTESVREDLPKVAGLEIGQERNLKTDGNNNKNRSRKTSSSCKTNRTKSQSQNATASVAELREKVATTTARLGETLKHAAEVARKTRHPLASMVIVALDDFHEQQAALRQLNEAFLSKPHEVREDQAVIIQPKVAEADQDVFVNNLLLAVDMEAKSVVKIYRDKKKDFLVIRFTSKLLVHAFLRRFRERNLFKLLGGARLTRDMNPEELDKYWAAVEQVAALNRALSGDHSFYVDLVTLQVRQKPDAVEDRSPMKPRANKSLQDTVSCDPSEYANCEEVKIGRPKSEGNYYDDGREINILRTEDAEAKRLQKERLGDDTLFVNVQKRVALERIPNPSETFDAMLLLFKEQRLWLNSVREMCYNCHFVCHIDHLATKLGKVIFLKTESPTLRVTTEKNQECSFKDAMTTSRHKRPGLAHRMISTRVVQMPVTPLDLLVFADEDCVAEEKRDGGDAFVLLKVRPQDEPFTPDFYRSTAPLWYFRALFSGIEKIVVGLRNEDNRIYDVTTLDREDLLKNAVGWNPSVCIHFLGDVLATLKSTLDSVPDLKTFVIEKKKGASEVRIEREAEARRFLPPPFVGAVLKMKP
ncbi:hypothetical protein QR680_014171 [Steinernema hermaphroditum]|uniref:Decapping nuclease n=1 Tax=Steinernema hermaphroditum TaxID=289476 RepID=A0AA39IAJ5_9BILA|nr:hypothetical protein QR680_014171 [Steinernema hermaphroditum]